MEATKVLAPAPHLMDPDSYKPESMEDWLDLIDLPEYTDVFQHQGYSSMERVKMLWEVELTSVSHYSNIVTSQLLLLLLSSSDQPTLQ